MIGDKLAVGLVGVGKIARDQHIPALGRSPRFHLAASTDQAGNQTEGVPGFPTLEAMLEALPGIDAVSLCVPPTARAALAAIALKAGKHVLLEKPPGAGVSEVHALQDLAKAQGVTLFTAWHSQFAPAVAPARAWLAGRTIRRVGIVWREDVRHWHPGQLWIWQPGGFGVFDPGINALSILVEILPGTLSVAAASLSVPENCQTPIAAEIAMRLTGGIPVDADFDFRQTGKQTWSITVETDDGALDLSEGGAALSLAGRPLDLPAKAEYDGVYRRFAELIDARTQGVDLRPLYLVADSYLVGGAKTVEPFL
jgi:D-galactose 1-dehydrogenase